jgi:hypothetical protein
VYVIVHIPRSDIHRAWPILTRGGICLSCSWSMDMQHVVLANHEVSCVCLVFMGRFRLAFSFDDCSHVKEPNIAAK